MEGGFIAFGGRGTFEDKTAERDSDVIVRSCDTTCDMQTYMYKIMCDGMDI